MMLSKMIATCGGIGYIKGGGTVAAICYTILWLLIRPSFSNIPVQVVLFILLTGVGVLISNWLERIWGKDSNKIVIDEVAGMCCTLLFVPHSWQYALVGLILFRFFDNVKPLFIRSAEKLPGGWGVMADDVLAGIYANLLLQLVVVANIFSMLTFLKAQASSLIASATDFLVTVFLVEFTGTRVVLASAEGTISGGIVNFIINRNWVFSGSEKKKRVQVFRYAIVWAGNLALNASGMYLVTHHTKLNYVLAKVLISLLVGFFYNYFLQKRFVFK